MPGGWASGERSMDVALADLRAAGWRSVTLWVLAENHPARDFYARFGFEPDGAEMTHESSREKEVRLRGRVTASGGRYGICLDATARPAVRLVPRCRRSFLKR